MLKVAGTTTGDLIFRDTGESASTAQAAVF